MSKAPQEVKLTAIEAALGAARLLMAEVHALEVRKSVLLAKIEPIKQRNLRLWRMPCTRAEVLKRVFDYVDASAAEFPRKANWAGVFRSFAYPDVPRPSNGGALRLETHTWHTSDTPINLQDVHTGVRGNRGAILGEAEGDAFEQSRTFFFFGDIIKAKIEQHFDRLLPELKASNGAEQESPQLTLEKRRAEIDENDALIAGLREEIDQVDRQLDELAQARGMKTPAAAGAA